jgi:hypothetical protein
MKPSNEFLVHRPGVVSMVIVCKAGSFATACWVWLAVLVLRQDPAGMWPMVAATGAGTTTVVAFVLGARHALQRNAAQRHEQVMRTLVEMSWQAFIPPAADSDPDVIRLPQESRRRPRR